MAIVRTARRLRQESGTEAEMSPTLAAALTTVEQEGPLTPSALAERERIQRPTVTRVVRRLEEAGLVTRTVDPGDRRTVHVAITPAGRALLRRIRTRKTQWLAQRLRGLDAEELATLARATAILERLQEQEPARPQGALAGPARPQGAAAPPARAS